MLNARNLTNDQSCVLITLKEETGDYKLFLKGNATVEPGKAA